MPAIRRRKTRCHACHILWQQRGMFLVACFRYPRSPSAWEDALLSGGTALHLSAHFKLYLALSLLLSVNMP